MLIEMTLKFIFQYTTLINNNLVDMLITAFFKDYRMEQTSHNSQDTEVLTQFQRFQTMVVLQQWHNIKNVLNKISSEYYNPEQLIKVLGKFKYASSAHNSKDKDKILFQALKLNSLKQLYRLQLTSIYAKIAQFVLKFKPHIYPVFKTGEAMEQSFNKEAIMYLICSMALFLVPKQKKTFNHSRDFSYIFNHSNFKTKAVIEFIKKELDNSLSNQYLTIRRVLTNKSVEQLINTHAGQQVCLLTMADDNDDIENYFGQLKVDFANRFIGGGALSSGCVQEQIMFANHPELYVTMILCEPMQANEAIQLIGFKKYSFNSGYGQKTTYKCEEVHKYTYDAHGRAKQYIIAIDALFLTKKETEQYTKEKVNREILKAYIGFKFQGEGTEKIVSGNWGCGAFGGNIKLKLLIQWIACSMAGKQLVYIPFGSRSQVYDNYIFSRISKLKIGEVYKILIQGCRRCIRQSFSKQVAKINIYEHMASILEISR